MLSASTGSWSSRYRSAFASARDTASGERVLSSNSMAASIRTIRLKPDTTYIYVRRTVSLRAKHSQQLGDRVVESVNHALFQRDDGVVCNRDALGTDLRAALGDVAISDAVLGLELARAVLPIERMHFERRRVEEKPGPDELIEQLMVAQHVADVLAEEALDALREFLHEL